MSQSSSATTLLKAPELSLQGGLQSVLQSLDVQLEDELVRYRREKRRQAQADKLKAQQALAAQAEAAQLAPAKETNLDSAAAEESTAPLSLSAAAEASEVTPGDTETAGTDEVTANSSSLAIIRQDNGETADNDEEDYFASSAALLESLGTMPEEDLEGIKLKSEETSFLKKLMTPAGVGASLLVLAAGAASGYLLMNPNSVSHLRFSELFPSSEEPAADNSIAIGTTAAKNIPAELPPGAPDLTQREFIQLSLSNLGSLDPNGNPIHSQSSLGSFSGLTTNLTVSTAQPLPGSITSTGGGGTAPGGMAPGGAATLPNVIQPIPESGLLSNLANAVSGRSTAEQMTAETPLPSVVSPVQVAPTPALPAPAPAAIAAAPVIQPMEVTQLPTPAPAPAPAPEPAPVIQSEAPAPEPIVAAPSEAAEITYWEPEPEVADTVAAAPIIQDSYTPIEEESYNRSSYIVVAPYISDAALAEIQSVVPDAYVENYDTGAFIQAGVFDDAASAGDLLMRLQDQGISASVENR